MASLQIEGTQLIGAAGKIVIITGGASGIGAAAARLFHSLGAKVIVGDLNEKLGNSLAAELGSNLVFQRCDVTQWSSLYDLFETANSNFGRIDIVLANAGVPEIEEIFEDKIDKATGKLLEPKYIVLDIDLKAVFSSE
jgi:NAD(P)-dependent dehydrogenase (short-subunit alcohol dehydrogenase family)